MSILSCICHESRSKTAVHIIKPDFSLQGFASGDMEKDVYSLRLFADSGMTLLLSQSYSKNMGLYGESVWDCCLLGSEAFMSYRFRLADK